MGTRSLTHVLDEDESTVLVTIYRQMDGYPTGHGQDLADFLTGRTLVNGFGSGTPDKASNGMGCLAASLVGTLKGGEIGGIYIEPPGSKDHGEDYVYTVYPHLVTSLGLKVQSVHGMDHLVTLFDGPVSEFVAQKVEDSDT
jgi:hypothetical protein